MREGTTAENELWPLKPGDRFGDCTVERLLGHGSMGYVFLVKASDGTQYALKVMSPELAKKDSTYKERFLREAEFAMKIRHRNLIPVHDAGEESERGFCYILMDYMPGGTVKDLVREKGALPVAQAVQIATQVAVAMEVAHLHGIIHRDIKPDNIMFDADGVPKLADLGVARFEANAHQNTQRGMIVGTPAYMAPEQMIDSHHIDERADIYSLGLVLYEMLAGKSPNIGSTVMGLLAKSIKGEPLPDVRTMRPEVSASVAYVLSLMLAPKVEQRPHTSRAAADLLTRAAAGSLLIPEPSTPNNADVAPPKPEQSPRRKRPTFIILLVIVALVGALAAAWWIFHHGHAKM
jgi:serine/threonine-protein kinase